MQEFYEVRELNGYTTAIVYDNGAIDEVSTHYMSGAAVRALAGGSYGFTVVDDIKRVDDAIDSAISLARRLNKLNPRPKIELASRPEANKAVYKIKKNPADLSLENKIELLKTFEKSLREYDTKGLINSTRINYVETFTHNRYRSSEGVESEHDACRTGFSLSVVAKDSGSMQMGRRSYFNIGGLEVFDQCDPHKMAEQTVSEAYQLLTAGASPAGRFDVILDQELAGVFIHEAVGHASEADVVIEGDSCLEGKIGEVIGNELVSVHDDPTLMQYGYYPYDSEGIPSQRTTIIDRGVLKSYLHSRETAAKLGGGRPGNARAGGLARPVVRMSNTFIDNGDMSKEEVFEGVNGIYLKGSRGGQVNTGEGVFQFNAVMGYIVKDGIIKEPIRDVSLSGNTLKTLKSITRVGNDLKFHSGRCGKAGQGVSVGDGSPHILVKDAVVGGSSG
jgi:TldD protein